MKKIYAVIVLVATLGAGPLYAGEELRTDSIDTVVRIIRERGDIFNPQKVLIVWDVDSTLLTPHSDLGSSFWFSWQMGLIKTPEIESEQVGLNQDALYKVTNAIRAAALMHTIEKNTVSAVGYLQKDGYPSIVLTGQPPMMRRTAEWQCHQNGINFSKSAIGKDISGNWKIGKGGDVADFSREELQKFGLESPREVSYLNGIFLGSDQHKGAMLRGLLHRLQLSEKFPAIIFVDDSERNCKDMQAAFTGKSGIKLTTILYTREHPRMDRFKAGDKWEAIAAFEQLRPELKAVPLAH